MGVNLYVDEFLAAEYLVDVVLRHLHAPHLEHLSEIYPVIVDPQMQADTQFARFVLSPAPELNSDQLAAHLALSEIFYAEALKISAEEELLLSLESCFKFSRVYALRLRHYIKKNLPNGR